MAKVLEAYYYALPCDGGYVELIGEDGTPMRDTDPEELKRLWLEDAKDLTKKSNRKFVLIKETLEAEEVA
jgi:hypothetical protein